MKVPQNIEDRITIWFSNPTSGYIFKGIEITISKRFCMPMFTAALFVIARTGKQSKHPSMCMYTHRRTTGYYAAIIKKDILPFGTI